MLGGALAIKTLPIAQYPSIAPPAIAISVSYPGASAATVQSTVVQVIAQQLELRPGHQAGHRASSGAEQAAVGDAAAADRSSVARHTRRQVDAKFPPGHRIL